MSSRGTRPPTPPGVVHAVTANPKPQGEPAHSGKLSPCNTAMVRRGTLNSRRTSRRGCRVRPVRLWRPGRSGFRHGIPSTRRPCPGHCGGGHHTRSTARDTATIAHFARCGNSQAFPMTGSDESGQDKARSMFLNAAQTQNRDAQPPSAPTARDRGRASARAYCRNTTARQQYMCDFDNSGLQRITSVRYNISSRRPRCILIRGTV